MQLQRSITESLEKSRTAILRRSKISPWRAENADYQGHGGAVNRWSYTLLFLPSHAPAVRLSHSDVECCRPTYDGSGIFSAIEGFYSPRALYRNVGQKQTYKK